MAQGAVLRMRGALTRRRRRAVFGPAQRGGFFGAKVGGTTLLVLRVVVEVVVLVLVLLLLLLVHPATAPFLFGFASHGHLKMVSVEVVVLEGAEVHSAEGALHGVAVPDPKVSRLPKGSDGVDR